MTQSNPTTDRQIKGFTRLASGHSCFQGLRLSRSRKFPMCHLLRPRGPYLLFGRRFDLLMKSKLETRRSASRLVDAICILGLCLPFVGCATGPAGHLSVATISPLHAIYRDGTAVLISEKVNTVEVWALTSDIWTRGLNTLFPPAFGIAVRNRSKEAFDFSPQNIAVFSGSNPVHIYSDKDIWNTVSLAPLDTHEQRLQIASKNIASMLRRNTVSDGQRAGGVIYVPASQMEVGRSFSLIVHLPGEDHQFLFDVTR
jgi:hypothetical protein